MSSFAGAGARRKYWWVLAGLVALGLLCGFGLLAYQNPMPVGSEVFGASRSAARTQWWPCWWWRCASRWPRWPSTR